MEYEHIRIASGRCADLRDVRWLVEQVLQDRDVSSQVRGATAAWETALQRIQALAANGPSGGGTYDECLKKYCPMCAQAISLLGQSASGEYNTCKNTNAKLINECVTGPAAPKPVAPVVAAKPTPAIGRPGRAGGRMVRVLGHGGIF